MKHWDPSDSPHEAARLSPGDQERLVAMIAVPVPAVRPARGRERPDLGSIIGLTLSLAFLAGLAWAISPVDPVSAEVR